MAQFFVVVAGIAVDIANKHRVHLCREQMVERLARGLPATG
jgi:hypothetical protein